MAITILSNITSMRAQSHLSKAQSDLSQSFERLSSGQRINNASDDAGGLALSESLKSQVRSFAVAERNSMNGVSMVETAEGGLSEVHDVLGRMRELAMQSSNGDLSAGDRKNLDSEYQELLSEAGRVITTTEFNGTSLLGGTAASVAFQVGIETSSDNSINVVFGGVTTASSDLNLDGTTVKDTTASATAMDRLDIAINSVASKRATFGAKMNRLNTAASNANTMRTNLAAAYSRTTDTDIAQETSVMARNQVLLQAGAAMLAQANMAPQVALSLLR
jgi:flagellin